MIGKTNIFTFEHKASSLLMMVMLAWLTISLPFVYASQQVQKGVSKNLLLPQEEESNPLTNTTEEKTSNGINTLSEEYLHDLHAEEHHTNIVVKYYKCHPSDLYFAFHPELISPPPEV